MGLESSPLQHGRLRQVGETADVATDTLEAADVGAEILHKATEGLRTALNFFGFARSSQKFVEALVKNKYMDNRTAQWLARLPVLKMMQVVSIVLSTQIPADMTQKKFADSLKTVQGISQLAEKSKNQMMMQHQVAEAPQMKLQHFIDQVRGPITGLRQQFGTTSDPVRQQAYRFVIANIFISYKNRIEREGLASVPGYEEKVEAMAGVPIDVTDLYDMSADYRKDYSLFKQTMFEIYGSEACNQVQLVVQDNKLLEYYEVLDLANDDQPGHEEYRKNNQKLINDAIAYFKEDANLEKVISYVSPEMAALLPKDSFGKKVPLDDIPRA